MTSERNSTTVDISRINGDISNIIDDVLYINVTHATAPVVECMRGLSLCVFVQVDTKTISAITRDQVKHDSQRKYCLVYDIVLCYATTTSTRTHAHTLAHTHAQGGRQGAREEKVGGEGERGRDKQTQAKTSCYGCCNKCAFCYYIKATNPTYVTDMTAVFIATDAAATTLHLFYCG